MEPEQFRIPARLEDLLRRDNHLAGVTYSILADYEPIVRWNDLPFFPEYTDHGKSHLESVLITSTALIPESSWQQLSSLDAALLVLSILFHDLGMHITESGFIVLVSSENDGVLAPSFDSETWAQLWETFLAEARRFDGKTLKRIFGSSEPVHRPPLDKESMTLRDRRLIGEFVRRNHPRLAHEIAINGFPGSADEVHNDSRADICDMAGLIARSHGIPIRSTLGFLEQRFHLREYKTGHPVYLMAVLRIADYLQVQAERAPRQKLVLADLRSPVSVLEWNLHSSVANITMEDDDPEAVFIDVRPSNVQSYLRAKALLKGLQSELDTTWAVLGEVFGRSESLSAFGLELRRVRSNLDDVAGFSKTVDYVPCRAAFEAADADLLRLLIQPLYGDDPVFGIRELVQNAADACLELRDMLAQDERYEYAAPLQTADISISLTDVGKDLVVFRISDKGIGMTADTILNYFLRAGASYRKSDAWREMHEDEEGHSRVLRSGRFGVGVLAGFLLGDELRITTRHMYQERGIGFAATIDADSMELKQIDRPIGTTIEIDLRSAVTMKLRTELGGKTQYFHGRDWRLPSDLYLLTSPSFEIKWNDRVYQLTDRWPSSNSKLPTGWHRIKPNGFDEVHWTYSGRTSRVACNGISVGSVTLPGWGSNSAVSFELPRISVFDPDGRLPLTLRRTEFSGQVSFLDELADDVARDVLAYCLGHGWDAGYCPGMLPQRPGICEHPALKDRHPYYYVPGSPYICTSVGFTVPDPYILQQLDLKSLVCFYGLATGRSIESIFGNQVGLMRRRMWELNKGDSDQVAIEAYENVTGKEKRYGANAVGARLVAGDHRFRRWEERGIPKSVSRSMTPDNSFEQWSSAVIGACGQASYTIEQIAQAFGSTDGICVEIFLSDKQPEIPVSPTAKAFKEQLNDWQIPYDPDERLRRFPGPFGSLAHYIEGHRRASPRSLGVEGGPVLLPESRVAGEEAEDLH